MSDRRLQYFLTAAAATLFAGALCFLLMRRQRNAGSGDVLDDVKRLGEVKRQTVDGKIILERRYFCNLSALVTFHQRLEFREEKAALVKQRQDIYSKLSAGSHESAYEDIVLKIYFSQETVFNQLFEEVLDSLGISGEEFKRSQIYYSTDATAIQSIREALRYGKPDAAELAEDLKDSLT